MAELLDELIALYAKHGLEDVKTKRAYKKLQAKHADNPGFVPALNSVRDVLEALEDLLGTTPKKQVKRALEEVSGYRLEPEKQKICRDLVLQRHAEFWSTQQRSHFTEASEKLSTWRPFFLSFTTFHPREGEVLPVNNRHSRLIDYGLKQVFGPRETMDQNLLARLVNYILNANGINGYYYPDHKDDSDVEDKLREHASSSITFIQILQNSMFSRWPNFCHIEYDAAARDDKRSLVFLLAEPEKGFVKRRDVDHRLREWYGVASRKDALRIEPVTEQSQVDSALAAIEEHVVKQVRTAEDRLFEQIPD